MQRMYARRARLYDLVHHVNTLWCDTRWRQEAAEAISKQSHHILDICTGTGLTIKAIFDRWPQKNIIGIDLNRGMLTVARERFIKANSVTFIQGDVQSLPFEEHTFDAVISVCGLGGTTDPGKVLHEIARVPHPAGTFLSIEMCTPPKAGIFKAWHKCVMEPLVKAYWGFRDIDLEHITRLAGLQTIHCEYRVEKNLGSICEIRARKA